MKALWRISLVVGLAATWLNQGVGVSQTASIREIQLNVTPAQNLSHTYFFFYENTVEKLNDEAAAQNLSHTYFFFYYNNRDASAGTANSDVFVQKLGNLTANVPFSQTLDLSSLPRWTSARYGLVGLNDETSELVTLGVNVDEATTLTNSPTYFGDAFPGWNESDIGTALRNDDISTVKVFLSYFSSDWTLFSAQDTDAALINFTVATYGGTISVSPVLTNKLFLDWEVFPGGLMLSWPAAATNYWVLEVSTNMTSWEVVTNGIDVSGDFCYFQDDMSRPGAFYRLRRF